MRWHAPSPLACAVALAGCIALCGPTSPRTPVGAIADDRIDDHIVGTVSGPIVRAPGGIGAPVLTVDSTVWVWSHQPLEPGQRVAITGLLHTPHRTMDPGAPPIRAVFEVSATHVTVLDPGGPNLWRWATGVQRQLASRVLGNDAASAALCGIVTGDRADVPKELDQRWRAVGIYHVLSVSGLHLAVVAGLAFGLLRRLVAASRWGGRVRPARWAAPIALALAAAYTFVTGAQIATLRTLLVVAIVLVAQMLDRPVRLVDALGVAAIVLLVWRPDDLYDPSFQLSFVAALTLALSRAHPGRGVWRWLVRGATTSAWVTITTAPITAWHFHQVAPGGVVGNLVLTPIVELCALPLGLAGVGLGRVGAPLVTAAVWLVARVDQIAGAIAHVMPLATIAVASGLTVALLVAVSLVVAARSFTARGSAIAWLVLCALWLCARSPAPPGALRVTFLDVGQGDAALVELPDGAVWLVDAGGAASARDLATASAPGSTIERALAAYGHAAIDLAIISHPHPDHYLGLAALGVPIRELWFAADVSDTPPRALPSFAAVSAALVARGTHVMRPALGTTTHGGVELVAWAPRYQALEGGPTVLAPDPVRSVNDNSLVVAIRYAGRSILFAGDLESEGEEALVAAGLPGADVVKVAHHGSRTSSSPLFVAITHPRLAVISCGVANIFGFPAPEVIARWQLVGARTLRTDRDGAVVVTVGADGSLVVDAWAN